MEQARRPLEPLRRVLSPAWKHLSPRAAALGELLTPAVRKIVPYSIRRAAAHLYHYDPPESIRREIRRDLDERVRGGPGPSFLYLPALSWFTWNFSRYHQMAMALAAEGCPVICAEPWFGDLHVSTHDAQRQREFVGLRELAPNLHLLRVPPWLLREYVAESVPSCLMMTWPFQADYIPPESSSLVVYEMIDDHALHGAMKRSWRRQHETWVRRADVMAASADDLVSQLRPLRSEILLLPNGVRIEDWCRPDLPVPDDLREARLAQRVVLYFGAMAEWFDWELWKEAAAARPNWAFVLIGFSLGVPEGDIKRRLAGRANVYYLGPKPYADLPGYLAHADVATIPFKLNEITHACSPVKLFEYMAAGKPIVATRMREILKYQSVLFADAPDAFVNRLEEAIQRSSDAEYRALLEAEAGANTWRARARTLREAVALAMDTRNLASRHGGMRPWLPSCHRGRRVE